MSDCRITVLTPDGKTNINALNGASFLTVLKRNGFRLNGCGGKGTCGRCRIRYLSGDLPLPTSADRIALTPGELRQGYRLACMQRVRRDCAIELAYVHSRQIDIVSGFAGDGSEDDRNRHTRYGGQEAPAVSDSRPQGTCAAEEYVIAIDLGTTTIAMGAYSWEEILAHESGRGLEELAQYHVMNPQRAWGSDVISRIQAAAKTEVPSLTEAVRTALRKGIEDIIAKMGRRPREICLAGNTVMEHLLMGWDVSGLGAYPFTPFCLGEARWEDVRLLPGISAFVGADITAGMLACGMEREGAPRLLIDLGTNGEMVLGDGKRFLCTATAAGSAFEGGASANLPGTDMVALLARLLSEGDIDETGLLRQELFDTGVCFGKIRITQTDIRALQMAKAAVRVGEEVLLEEYAASCSSDRAAGGRGEGRPVPPDPDVSRGLDDAGALEKTAPVSPIVPSRVYLAGGFGYYLDVDAAARIGLLAPALVGKVRAVGNASLLGAALYADERQREKARRMIAASTVMNLAEQPDFNERYLNQLGFTPEG